MFSTRSSQGPSRRRGRTRGPRVRLRWRTPRVGFIDSGGSRSSVDLPAPLCRPARPVNRVPATWGCPHTPRWTTTLDSLVRSRRRHCRGTPSSASASSREDGKLHPTRVLSRVGVRQGPTGYDPVPVPPPSCRRPRAAVHPASAHSAGAAASLGEQIGMDAGTRPSRQPTTGHARCAVRHRRGRCPGEQQCESFELSRSSGARPPQARMLVRWMSRRRLRLACSRGGANSSSSC